MDKNDIRPRRPLTCESIAAPTVPKPSEPYVYRYALSLEQAFNQLTLYNWQTADQTNRSAKV